MKIARWECTLILSALAAYSRHRSERNWYERLVNYQLAEESEDMRIQAIEAHNYLSFRQVRIEDLNSHVNFIVGPNGSGKTSVARLLGTFRDTFHEYADGKLPHLANFLTYGAPTGKIDLSLDVEFSSDEERMLIAAFLAASLSNSDVSSMRRGTDPATIIYVTNDGKAAFSGWLLQELASDAAHFLFTGTLRITFRREAYEKLWLSYTVKCGDVDLSLVTGYPFFGSGTLLTTSDPLFDGIQSTSLETALPEAFAEQDETLDSLKNLLSGSTLTGPSNFNVAAFLTSLGHMHVPIAVKDAGLANPYPPAHYRVEELTGKRIHELTSSRGDFSLSHLIDLILRRDFVFTNNLRAPLTEAVDFDWKEQTEYEDLRDERSFLPHLFRLKNGEYRRRERYKAIQTTFGRLLGSHISFEIVAAPVENADHQAALEAHIIENGRDTPITFHGAGMWEALILSVLLDDTLGQVVLLDEPAANLHPSVQHRLVELLREKAKQDRLGQILLVSHSAHVLPTKADEFEHVYRFSKREDDTEIYGLNADQRRQLHITPDKMEQELSSSSDVGGLLFASGVILVEGDTELGALTEWFPKSKIGASRTFADLNLALYAVGGKTDFGFYLRFLSAFEVPCVVICDGDAYSETNALWGTLESLRLISNGWKTLPFADLRTLGERAGVFTANTSVTEKFETIPAVKACMDEHDIHTKSKVRNGRLVARYLDCPAEFERILEAALTRLKVQ